MNTSLIVRCLIIFIITGFLSCEQDNQESTILSHQEMVKVLTEIYIAEDKIHRLALPPDSSAKVFALWKEKIALKTGIPDSVFKKSLDYYVDRPKEMELIYTALVDSLNLKEQRSSFED